VEKTENGTVSWTFCEECQGSGKKARRLRNKVRLCFKKACGQFEISKNEGSAPLRPKRTFYSCAICGGSGIIPSAFLPKPDKENYPHVANIGGGIGGVALAVPCLHRGIPFTLFERDNGFNTQFQSYELTLKQASKYER
jgi:NADPH-dependent 2,4-dienoyl-CoA reductase/sulfur reductase-like enzyme